VLAPVSTSLLVLLFCTTPVTLGTDHRTDRDCPRARPGIGDDAGVVDGESGDGEVPVLLALKVRFPVPVLPPDRVNSEFPVEFSVVPLALTVMALVEMVSASMLLAWVMAVTLVPTPPRSHSYSRRCPQRRRSFATLL